MVASSGNSEKGSFTSLIIAVDNPELSQSIIGDEIIDTDISVMGIGPVQVSGYASEHSRKSVLEQVACVFLTD